MAYKDTVEVKITSGGGGASAYEEPTELDVYRFHSTDADFLEFGKPFTGVLKIILAGTSSAGVAPDIMSWLLSPWEDSVNLNKPKWNSAEVSVVNFTVPVDNTFNGLVLKYAKDDVWYTPDRNGVIT